MRRIVFFPMNVMTLISAPADISSKDLPLREDVRLLGRIFGDTLREQEGEASFRLIENVRRAVEVFGFHLAPLDMRQHNAIHEQTVTELFLHSSGEANYKYLDEAARREVLLGALQAGKPLLVELEQYTPATQSELRIMQAAAQIHQRFGHEALPNRIISKNGAASDMLEVALSYDAILAQPPASRFAGTPSRRKQ